MSQNEKEQTDAKNGATTRAKRGMFLQHEGEIQNDFQAMSYLQI